MLDLICANKGEVVRDVKVGGSFACNDCGMVVFKILRGGNSRIISLKFRRAVFVLFRNLLEKIP